MTMQTDIKTTTAQLYGDIDLPECDCTWNVVSVIVHDSDTGFECDSVTAELISAQLGGFAAPRSVIEQMIGAAYLTLRESDAAKRFMTAMDEGGTAAIVDGWACDAADARSAA